MCDVTENPEGIDTGTLRLVGNKEKEYPDTFYEEVE